MKPRLLDLFCGAGGAAMGYSRAGFDVVGVDIKPQPRYPFEFVQGDALSMSPLLLERVREDIDAIHASPPCQFFAGSTAWRGRREDHPNLIAPTRELLLATGLPYVVENVPDARRHLINPVMICGSTVGIPLRRHRYFEANWPLSILAYPCQHRAGDYAFDHGGKQTESVYRDAMGCEWMTVEESREAIPPAYTEFIGTQLMAYLKQTVTA